MHASYGALAPQNTTVVLTTYLRTIAIIPRGVEAAPLAFTRCRKYFLQHIRRIFCFASPSRDGKTRRERPRGRFAPRVSKAKCAFRYALRPRPGQPRVRPTPRLPSPSPQRRQKSTSSAALLSASGCASSMPGVIAHEDQAPRWKSGRGLGSRTRKASRDACGGCR